MFIIKDLLHWISRYRLKLVVLSAAAVWAAVWAWPRSTGRPDSKLTLVFCAVGQGDASVISRGFTQVLIDSGPNSPKAADCLGRHLPFFDRRLEAVIVSHPQTDHFGGLPEVIKRYQVDKFIFNGAAGDSRGWEELSRLIAAEKSQVITLAEGDKLKTGEIEIDVLWPTDKSYKSYKNYNQGGDRILGISSSRDLNADALVLNLSYGDFSALFTGDIGRSQESAISRHPSSIVSATVLKVAHHGSKTSSSAEFLKAVKPELAVIEVGKNSYGHPADEVLKRLENIGAKVFRTDRDGDVVVETDGKKWTISTISN